MAKRPAPMDYWDYFAGLLKISTFTITVVLVSPLVLAYVYFGSRR